MENRNKNGVEADRDICFSRSIKAGKRIYYIDVKKSRNDEMYIAVTESKKVPSGVGGEGHVSFEKHKIFLYREDFDPFATALQEAVSFVTEQQGEAEPRASRQHLTDEEADTKADAGEIKLDIEF